VLENINPNDAEKESLVVLPTNSSLDDPRDVIRESRERSQASNLRSKKTVSLGPGAYSAILEKNNLLKLQSTFYQNFQESLVLKSKISLDLTNGSPKKSVAFQEPSTASKNKINYKKIPSRLINYLRKKSVFLSILFFLT